MSEWMENQVVLFNGEINQNKNFSGNLQGLVKCVKHIIQFMDKKQKL